MDGTNYSQVVYLGRRNATVYLFKQTSGNVLEFEEDILFGCSILKVGQAFNIKQMRANCYVVS